jgi:hypothetical protein
MSFLNKDNVVVDAVITKEGRKLLAQQGSIRVKYAKVSDFGVNYELWNEDHPDGSDYYGQAIEEQPMLQANAHSGLNMLKDSLVTLPQNSTHLPVVNGVKNIDFGAIVRKEIITPSIHPVNQHSNWIMLVTDGSLIELAKDPINAKVKQTDEYNELIRVHLSWEGITSPKAFRFDHGIAIQPAEVDTTHTIQYLIVEENTGFYSSGTISMTANELIKTLPITDNPVGNS